MLPALRYRGVQFYCGAEQHIADFAARREAVLRKAAYLKEVLDALQAAGFTPEVVTGGGTGSHQIGRAHV